MQYYLLYPNHYLRQMLYFDFMKINFDQAYLVLLSQLAVFCFQLKRLPYFDFMMKYMQH